MDARAAIFIHQIVGDEDTSLVIMFMVVQRIENNSVAVGQAHSAGLPGDKVAVASRDAIPHDEFIVCGVIVHIGGFDKADAAGTPHIPPAVVHRSAVVDRNIIALAAADTSPWHERHNTVADGDMMWQPDVGVGDAGLADLMFRQRFDPDAVCVVQPAGIVPISAVVRVAFRGDLAPENPVCVLIGQGVRHAAHGQAFDVDIAGRHNETFPGAVGLNHRLFTFRCPIGDGCIRQAGPGDDHSAIAYRSVQIRIGGILRLGVPAIRRLALRDHDGVTGSGSVMGCVDGFEGVVRAQAVVGIISGVAVDIPGPVCGLRFHKDLYAGAETLPRCVGGHDKEVDAAAGTGKQICRGGVGPGACLFVHRHGSVGRIVSVLQGKCQRVAFVRVGDTDLPACHAALGNGDRVERRAVRGCVGLRRVEIGVIDEQCGGVAQRIAAPGIGGRPAGVVSVLNLVFPNAGGRGEAQAGIVGPWGLTVLRHL